VSATVSSISICLKSVGCNCDNFHHKCANNDVGTVHCGAPKSSSTVVLDNIHPKSKQDAAVFQGVLLMVVSDWKNIDSAMTIQNTLTLKAFRESPKEMTDISTVEAHGVQMVRFGSSCDKTTA